MSSLTLKLTSAPGAKTYMLVNFKTGGTDSYHSSEKKLKNQVPVIIPGFSYSIAPEYLMVVDGQLAVWHAYCMFADSFFICLWYPFSVWGAAPDQAILYFQTLVYSHPIILHLLVLILLIMMSNIMRACVRVYGIVCGPTKYGLLGFMCSSFYFEWGFSFYGLSHKSQDSFCHNMKTVPSYNPLLGEQYSVSRNYENGIMSGQKSALSAFYL